MSQKVKSPSVGGKEDGCDCFFLGNGEGCLSSVCGQFSTLKGYRQASGHTAQREGRVAVGKASREPR